jgi:hypothetical protein
MLYLLIGLETAVDFLGKVYSQLHFCYKAQVLVPRYRPKEFAKNVGGIFYNTTLGWQQLV